MIKFPINYIQNLISPKKNNQIDELSLKQKNQLEKYREYYYSKLSDNHTNKVVKDIKDQ